MNPLANMLDTPKFNMYLTLQILKLFLDQECLIHLQSSQKQKILWNQTAQPNMRKCSALAQNVTLYPILLHFIFLTLFTSRIIKADVDPVLIKVDIFFA
jgi:hypothetical protein